MPYQTPMPASPTNFHQNAVMQQRLQHLQQMQALGQLGIPDKVYQSYIENFESIQDKNHRIQA